MEFLKIENLCKVYGKGENQVTALDHVSLTIEKGEFTALIGSSGSGKSTLLHIIGGVDVPTSGKVYLDGQDVYAQSNGGKHHLAYPNGQAQGQLSNSCTIMSSFCFSVNSLEKKRSMRSR